MITKSILLISITQTRISQYGEYVSLHRDPDIFFAQKKILSMI